jgi:hypothetical protein
VIWLAMIAVISTYRIGRGDHEDNLRQLAERKAASGDKSGVANNSSTN